MQQLDVGKLRKGEEFPSDMNVYQQLLKEVTTERDELKRSLERVNARWDGKVKRLEAQLALKSVDTIAVEVFALLINLLSLYCSCMLTYMHTALLCN